MSDAERFDAFYAEARDRLLVQAFALTGDLPASRGAVRDGFIAAWHRWKRVRRLHDPEAWVRPHAWIHAQRRHTARIWHRDKSLDPEVRATLDALAKLSVTPRKALLLAHLSSASPEEVARELGDPLAESEHRLQAATEQFARHREVPTAAVRPLLDQLAESCAGQRWPRATIIRRAGAARRRTHALVGAALVVGTLVGTGSIVQDSAGVRPTLDAARARLTTVPGSLGGGSSQAQDHAEDDVSTAALVTRGQATLALPGRAWRVTGTVPARGMTLPCQRRPYADPDASAMLVRNFTSHQPAGHQPMAAMQTVEYSADATGAKHGFATAASWFAGCTTPQTQLLSVRRVAGLGEEAQQYALRTWHHPAATFVLGIARTGRVTTVALTRTAGTARPDLPANLRLLVAAVDDLCGTSVGGQCSSRVRPRFVAPPRAGQLPMMLSEFDLPQVAGVRRPWVGTTPRKALDNLAATGCDDSSFHGPLWRHDITRSFLVPGGHLSAAFGITETVGSLPPPRARAFVAGVRKKMASCSSRDYASKVLRITSTADLAVWRVRMQVTDKQTVTYDMGIVRNGGAVAQVGFVADRAHTMTDRQLVALVRRAGQRLAAMPG